MDTLTGYNSHIDKLTGYNWYIDKLTGYNCHKLSCRLDFTLYYPKLSEDSSNSIENIQNQPDTVAGRAYLLADIENNLYAKSR